MSEHQEEFKVQHVDLTLSGGIVLTMNKSLEVLTDHTLVVDAGRIKALVPTPTATSQYVAKERVDARDSIVMPGLVNTHTHSPLTLIRGVSDDLSLMDWLRTFIWPFEKAFVTAPFVELATRLAVSEMVLGGTTTFNDSYFFSGAVAKAASSMGVRCIAGEIVLDFETPSARTPEDAIAYVRECMEQWRADPLVRVAVAPHSPYTCSEATLRQCAELALEHDALFNIHLAESRSELDEITQSHGCSPVAYLAHIGCFEPRVIAAHCVHVTDDDIALLAERSIGVAHNPESNMKLGNGVAPITRLLARGVSVGLGTDGAASNNDLSLLSEADFAAKLQKGSLHDARVLTSVEAVRMLTIGGAEALGLSNDIGSLEVGKRADIAVISTRRPHLVPMYNPYSHVVYAARDSDVEVVVIEGKIIVRGGQLVGHDLSALLEEVRAKAAEIGAHLGLSPVVRQ